MTPLHTRTPHDIVTKGPPAAPATATLPRRSQPRRDLPRCLLPANLRRGEPGFGEGVTARRGDGDSTGNHADLREAARSPQPLLPRSRRPAWRCTAATFSSRWVQKVCRRDEGTTPRQSQPGPEHLTCRIAGTAATGRSPERSSRLGGDRGRPAGQGRGDRGCRRLRLGRTTTHRQGRLLHRWLPAPPVAGRQPGLPGVPGCQ